MANTLSPEAVVERAEKALRDRTKTVESAAIAHVRVAKTKEEADQRRAALEEELRQSIAEAERAEVAAYNAAITSGWTEAELKRIGIPTPAKKSRATKNARTKRTAAKKHTPGTNAAVSGADAPDTAAPHQQ